MLGGLALLTGGLYFAGLGGVGLFDADEPAYAQAAREMLERGDWITPTFNGTPRFDKPVLFYWLITLGYRLLGVTELAVRCWSALAGMLLVLLTASAARRWLGPPADLWSGLALATSLLTALLARAAVTDMLLTLGVTAAILAGVAALEGPAEAGRRWARIGWAAMGMAVLVKGPIGLVVPGLALGGGLLLLREFRSGLRRLVPWEGPAILLALTAPWYGLVLAANGWAFVEGFIVKHHLTRYTGVVSSHAGPFWYYLPVLLVGFFPWSAYLVPGAWRAWQHLKTRRGAGGADRLLATAACWGLGELLLFSLGGTKLPSYIFPAFPALALLAGGLGVQGEHPAGQPRSGADPDGRMSVVGLNLSVPPPPRWVSLLEAAIIGGVGFALAAGFAALPWILEAARPASRGVLEGVSIPMGLPAWLAALLAAGTALALGARGPRRAGILAAAMAVLIATAALGLAPVAHGILQGALGEYSRDARRLLPADEPVLVYGLNAPSIVFYAERRVLPLGPGTPDGTEEIRRRLAAGRPVVVITRSSHAARLEGLPGLARGKSRNGYAIYWSDRLGNSSPAAPPS